MGIVPEAITDKLSDRPTTSAVVVYALVCAPLYAFFSAPHFVGIDHSSAGTVGGSVVIGGLVLGALMFVPALHIRFKQQYGGGQARRLNFVDGGGE